MTGSTPGRPDLAAALAEFPVFAGLPEGALATLAAGALVETVPDGATIFAQGDEADHVFAILRCEGRVRVGAPAANAKRLMVEVFKELEIFGELAVLDRGQRSADASADGAVRLVRLRAGQFREVLATTPALGIALLKLLTARLRRTFALFQDASFETLDVRLARQLLYLARVGSRRVDQGLRLAGRFRQGDLANLLGATTRSIITILNDWRARGVLAYDAERGLITVLDEAFFNRLVAAEEDEGRPRRPSE
jgi:CRP/FNR family cyclic AMP-dependent transcriptional regulator